MAGRGAAEGGTLESDKWKVPSLGRVKHFDLAGLQVSINRLATAAGKYVAANSFVCQSENAWSWSPNSPTDIQETARLMGIDLRYVGEIIRRLQEDKFDDEIERSCRVHMLDG